MFSLQQQRWRSCALFLIATSDTRYEREHDRRGGGDVAISFARSLFADSVSKTVNLALPYSLHVCSGCASHGIWRIALILVNTSYIRMLMPFAGSITRHGLGLTAGWC
jgi:hypothetical protein